MRRPVVGVIGTAYRIEDRFATQMVGERNLRAVAEVSGALPLMFAGAPDITDIGALLDAVDGIVLTGARANVHPTNPTTCIATKWRWRCRRSASPAAFRCSGSAAACRR
jgi:gamma-glutamyl-gamma-aminobutyrate hydrolase PuuD